jgi:acetyl-CoA/propionyl-CoA carboxylase biotin carboxyl carrier protein
VRVDSAVAEGSEIPKLYDSMVAKLIVHDVDREHARRRMLRALEEFEIGGVTTLLGFHRVLLSHPCFVDATTCKGLVESEELAAQAAELTPPTPAARPTGQLLESVSFIEVDGRRVEVRTLEPEPPYRALARLRRERGLNGQLGGAHDRIVSPMQGTVLVVNVADGDAVTTGQVICIVEAMKMENEIHSHRAGTVSDLSVTPGEAVTTGQVICRLLDS